MKKDKFYKITKDYGYVNILIGQKGYGKTYYEIKKIKEKLEQKDKEIERLKERVQIGQNAFLSLNSKIEKAIKSIDIVEEIIKEQPDDFGNGDMWILKRLEGFKFILKGSDEE